jgi:hypothetical protein
MYAYFQPFLRNFYFLNKLFLFVIKQKVLFEFLIKNLIEINGR